MDKILIIGGNAAGLTAASRARRLNPRLKITVLEKLPQMAYSTCGLPYFVSGLVPADRLISHTPESFKEERGIDVLTNVRVESILQPRKRVEAVRTDTGEALQFSFDRLLISTGVRPRVPPFPGMNLGNVFTLGNLPDAIRIREAVLNAERVSIIGAGYVGLEMAEAVHALGKGVTIYERQPHVLPAVDADIAQIVEYELRRFGVQVLPNANVLALTGGERQENHQPRVTAVKTASGLGVAPADVVLVDVGVDAETSLAKAAGIHIGQSGAIAVDPYMETNLLGVYAAGNCAEAYCPIRRRAVTSAVGTTAAKQGRIAGENLAGRRSRFNGAIGTAVLKVFELGVARTGLTSEEAAAESIPVVSARIEAQDRASYYPGTRKVWVKLIVERASRKVIGAQAAGYGEVSKPVDVAATAISCGMKVDDVEQLDLAYSPPYSSLWDPLLIAAQAVIRRLE